MFHVYQVVSPGFSRNSSKFQNLNIFKTQSQYGGTAWNSYKSQGLYRGRARNFSESQSLYRGEEIGIPTAYMVYKGESLEFFQDPKHRRKLELAISPSLRTYLEGKRSEFFQVPATIYVEGKRSEFF